VVHGAGGWELLMVTDDRGKNRLHLTTFYGRLEIAKVLFDADGSEWYIPPIRGRQICLQQTSFRGHLEVVKALVNVGDCRLLILTDFKGCS